MICGAAAFTIYDEINRHKALIQEGSYAIVNSVIGYALLGLVLGAAGLVFSIKTFRFYTAGKSSPEELIDDHGERFSIRRALQLNPFIWLLTLCFVLGFLSLTIYMAISLYDSIMVTEQSGYNQTDMWKMYRPQIFIIFFLFATAAAMLIDYLNLWVISRRK